MSVQPLTWVEISRSALRHQTQLFTRAVPKQTRVFAVVKSNAYGHGMAEVISILNHDASIAGFAVVCLDEAMEAVRLTSKPVIVLSIWQRDEEVVARAVRKNVILPIYDVASARWLNTVARKINRRAAVHLKIDVGTMRLGFRYDAWREISPIQRLRNVSVTGVFSHFADSENQDESFTLEQAARFNDVVQKLSAAGVRNIDQHIACSAAMLRNPSYAYTMTRLGLGLYGLWPSRDLQTMFGGRNTFIPALTWKTRIIQIKKLKSGESVGYGLSYRAPRDTRLAVLPVGYWDGYDRRLSNLGEVLIRGVRCPVRGRVCMNLTMVELPDRVVAKTGTEVILLGGDGSHVVSAEELARHCGTINYEIVTRINPCLPRLIKP